MANLHLHILVLLVSIIHLVVVGHACAEIVGYCPTTEDCNRGCQSRHINSQVYGECQHNLCTCSYSCEPPSIPPVKKKKCLSYGGLCIYGQCREHCAILDNGIGFCSFWHGQKLCLCQFDC